jgi:hypothetical protein
MSLSLVLQALGVRLMLEVGPETTTRHARWRGQSNEAFAYSHRCDENQAVQK